MPLNFLKRYFVCANVGGMMRIKTPTNVVRLATSSLIAKYPVETAQRDLLDRLQIVEWEISAVRPFNWFVMLVTVCGWWMVSAEEYNMRCRLEVVIILMRWSNYTLIILLISSGHHTRLHSIKHIRSRRMDSCAILCGTATDRLELRLQSEMEN